MILKSLDVQNCEKLWTLFPCEWLLSSKAYVFTSNLEELIVSDCSNLKYLLVPEEGVVPEEVFVKFLFPKLKTLALHGLLEFNTFYPGKHAVEGSILEKLELYDCNKMQQSLYLFQQVCKISFSILPSIIFVGI